VIRFLGGALAGILFTVGTYKSLPAKPEPLDLRAVVAVVTESCLGFPVEEAEITRDRAKFRCQSGNVGKMRVPKPPPPVKIPETTPTVIAEVTP
jgi:hypothetical protein